MKMGAATYLGAFQFTRDFNVGLTISLGGVLVALILNIEIFLSASFLPEGTVSNAKFFLEPHLLLLLAIHQIHLAATHMVRCFGFIVVSCSRLLESVELLGLGVVHFAD